MDLLDRDAVTAGRRARHAGLARPSGRVIRGRRASAWDTLAPRDYPVPVDTGAPDEIAAPLDPLRSNALRTEPLPPAEHSLPRLRALAGRVRRVLFMRDQGARTHNG